MRWLDGITNGNGHKLGQTSLDGVGQGVLACCSPWVCKESDTTAWLNTSSKVTCHMLSTRYILAILERRSETGMSLSAKENFLVKKKNPDFNSTNWARCNLIRINKCKVLGLPWWYSG